MCKGPGMTDAWHYRQHLVLTLPFECQVDLTAILIDLAPISTAFAGISELPEVRSTPCKSLCHSALLVLAAIADAVCQHLTQPQLYCCLWGPLTEVHLQCKRIQTDMHRADQSCRETLNPGMCKHKECAMLLSMSSARPFHEER